MRTKARYQVILAYDGTRFSGFQRQAHGRTVQEVVEAALQRLNWQGSSLLGAGRTDKGVHASGQVIAFDLEWGHSPQELQRAINANLPSDVSACEVRVVPDSFHPRYDARSRCYRYQIFCQPVRNPLRERYAWRVWPEVWVSSLQEAASYLVGKHDFAAFGTPPRAGGSTIRTVFQADWQELEVPHERSVLVFEIIADAFLYHMVRRLVAYQVEIGQGSLDVNKISGYLNGDHGPYTEGLAPPNGLVLAEVNYPEDVWSRSNLENKAF